MADRDISGVKLADLTGFAYGTIIKLRNSPPSHIKVETLNSLCNALECQPGELLEWEPETTKVNTLPNSRK